ncbi:uncharacterized protein LOC117101835 [Anneissia japonica]|uniref:uncharacterized protein LOC117101835 n=1 Tax=Anneissia japonica TaxID=1529436 RepID=UPI001425678B|nr:uncharacterized protein LOC117101835 [Anneissia japonica]
MTIKTGILQVFGLRPVIMSRPYCLIVVMLFAFHAKIPFADAAFFYKAPSNVTVIAGNAFNVSCGIANVSDTDILVWVRFPQNKPVIMSFGKYAYTYEKKKPEVSITPEYMLKVINADISDEGVYQCGVMSKGSYTPFANATVTVLQVASTMMPWPPTLHSATPQPSTLRTKTSRPLTNSPTPYQSVKESNTVEPTNFATYPIDLSTNLPSTVIVTTTSGQVIICNCGVLFYAILAFGLVLV